MLITKRTAILSAVAIVFAANLAYAQSQQSIAIEKPFSRATPGGAKVGVGYMTITNKGATADRLV